MWWLVLALLAAIFALVLLRIWRRWIVPWHHAQKLVESIVQGEQPRAFLLTSNPPAHQIGLALEKIWDRQRELVDRAHEREFSFEAILGAMLDGLVVIDDQRRIQMANPAFARLVGRDAVTAGTFLFETLRDATVEHAVTETIRTGEPHQHVLRMSRNSGDAAEVEVSAMALHEKSNRVRGAVLLFRDITQLKRVEEVRRDFVANVSHELRTPLSIFRGYLETLLEDPKQPPAELRRIFEVMEKHSNRLNLLVEDVLSLAQLEEPKTRFTFYRNLSPGFSRIDFARLAEAFRCEIAPRFARSAG